MANSVKRLLFRPHAPCKPRRSRACGDLTLVWKSVKFRVIRCPERTNFSNEINVRWFSKIATKFYAFGEPNLTAAGHDRPVTALGRTGRSPPDSRRCNSDRLVYPQQQPKIERPRSFGNVPGAAYVGDRDSPSTQALNWRFCFRVWTTLPQAWLYPG